MVINSSCKTPGVFVDPKLTMNQEYDAVLKKVKATMKFINRSKKSRNWDVINPSILH